MGGWMKKMMRKRDIRRSSQEHLAFLDFDLDATYDKGAFLRDR
jgi:hypothetical protein